MNAACATSFKFICVIPAALTMLPDVMSNAPLSDCNSAAAMARMLLELLCCPQRCFTAERSAARGPGAAAHRRSCSIATDDHNYIGIDAHFLRNDLNQRGASTLALIGDAGHATMPPSSSRLSLHVS